MFHLHRNYHNKTINQRHATNAACLLNGLQDKVISLLFENFGAIYRNFMTISVGTRFSGPRPSTNDDKTNAILRCSYLDIQCNSYGNVLTFRILWTDFLHPSYKSSET